MRRPLLLALAMLVLSGSGLSAQQGSLDGSVGSGLSGALGSGLSGEVPSGLSGALGSTQQGRSRAVDLPTQGTYLDPRSCAPGQASLNSSGCRPIEWFSRDSVSSYDRSIEGMSPLRGLKLEERGSGPFELGGGPYELGSGPYMAE